MKILLSILLVTTLFATATLTKIRTFTQSNGMTFKGRLQGDAFLHWIEAEDGSILLFNKKTANFEYAKIENGDIVLSGIIYSNSKLRALHIDKSRINISNLKELWKIRHPKK